MQRWWAASGLDQTVRRTDFSTSAKEMQSSWAQTLQPRKLTTNGASPQISSLRKADKNNPCLAISWALSIPSGRDAPNQRVFGGHHLFAIDLVQSIYNFYKSKARDKDPQAKPFILKTLSNKLLMKMCFFSKNKNVF